MIIYKTTCYKLIIWRIFADKIGSRFNHSFLYFTSFNVIKFREVVKLVIRNLNKIIDYNYYPVREAETSNRKNRPVGAGIQGLSDIFAMMKCAFDSDEARVINRKIFENMYLAACESSMEIARKRKKIVQEYKRLLKVGTGVDASAETDTPVAPEGIEVSDETLHTIVYCSISSLTEIFGLQKWRYTTHVIFVVYQIFENGFFNSFQLHSPDLDSP